ncbi:MAG: Imidazole glycerol phosphate synthase subunit HisF [Candidatus Hodgkinia cicadicola]|nr:MAG: Imidazole glycerol phosphate synthase subunit HisF [Candidatus Hodgkinia cicadicola]
MLTGLSVRIIPCMDIRAGLVVKGTEFGGLVVVGEPALVANDYSLNGADELCFLDISASSSNRSLLYNAVTKVAENCFIPLTVGGGVRKSKDVRKLLSAGADKVAVNSASATNLGFISECADKFGSQCVVASVDCKAVNGAWEVYSHGGSRPTGVDALEYVCKAVEFGAGEVLLTSIDRDGLSSGYDLVLLKTVCDLVQVPVIASGGAGALNHLVLAIRDGGAAAVLVASLLHKGNCTLSQIKYFFGKCGVLVRDDYLRYGLYDE